MTGQAQCSVGGLLTGQGSQEIALCLHLEETRARLQARKNLLVTACVEFLYQKERYALVTDDILDVYIKYAYDVYRMSRMHSSFEMKTKPCRLTHLLTHTALDGRLYSIYCTVLYSVNMDCMTKLLFPALHVLSTQR